MLLPAYFDRINTDFRYQLTVIGQFAQAIVGKEIAHNRFVIRTSKPRVRVSWQVTARRNDAYMRAHPFAAVQDKTGAARGKYLTPSLYGKPSSMGIMVPPGGSQGVSVLPTTTKLHRPHGTRMQSVK